jgi:hypothetical protein
MYDTHPSEFGGLHGLSTSRAATWKKRENSHSTALTMSHRSHLRARVNKKHRGADQLTSINIEASD